MVKNNFITRKKKNTRDLTRMLELLGVLCDVVVSKMEGGIPYL